MKPRGPKDISKKTVDTLAPGKIVTDVAIRGFQARCLPSGKVRFTFRYSLPGRPQKEIKLGLHGEVTVEQARRLAADHAHAVRAGRDPAAEVKAVRDRSENTVDRVLDQYLEHQKPVRKAASYGCIESAFRRVVRPAIGAMAIYDVKKSDIAKVFDAAPGPVAADTYWRYLRAAFNWHADRDDDFVPPKVKQRLKASDLARDRVLSDDEIRDLWQALDELELGHGVPASFPRFVRALLLCAQRRTNVATMHADEFTAEGWIIPADKMKGGKGRRGREHLLYVTDALREQIGTGQSGFVFSSDGGKSALGNFAEGKEALDLAITTMRKRERRKAMPHWVFHDLRRTARSIMSRYATPDVAERVLGHVIAGVRGVYDRYDYAEQKRDALVALATHINGVVHPRPDNVVRLKHGLNFA